uniref:Glutathione peroxidase n=2 Tax=Anthurium amnicola TaxID=1678845 RepID=A0A1D1XYQ8_9ARAE
MICSFARFASPLPFFLSRGGTGLRQLPPPPVPSSLSLFRHRLRGLLRCPPAPVTSPRAAAAASSFSHLDSVSSLLPLSHRPQPRWSPLQRPIPSSRLVSVMAASSTEPPKSVHDFTVKDARGNDVDLSTYKGKVLLIVNVASQCGLTNSNYTELSQLYEKYKDKDFEILAFPCNQFGGQEPGSNEQIVEFACTRFKAEYPIFDKVDVNGQSAAPIYKFLKTSKGGLFGDSIKWNFSKFLVDKEGNVVDRYAPTTSPLSIEKDVKKLLDLS